MAFLNPIKYKRELEKVLFPSNSFIVKGKSDDNSGSFATIQYPESSAIGAPKTGSPSLPLSIQNTEHTSAEYTTEQIYVMPELVKNEDEMLTNYSIFTDIRDQQAEQLMTRMHDIAAYNWGPSVAGRIRLTTGLDTTGGTARYRANTLTGSATGNRYRIGKEDMLWAYRTMMKDNNNGGQVYALITPDMYEDLLLIEDFISYEKTGQVAKLVNGLVGRLMGIEFIIRWNTTIGSVGLHYTQAKAKKDNYKADGSVNNAADDGAAALFFKGNAVRYAKAPLGVSINRNAPGYLGGTILEAWTRFGGTVSRTDEIGVLALVEGKKA